MSDETHSFEVSGTRFEVVRAFPRAVYFFSLDLSLCSSNSTLDSRVSNLTVLCPQPWDNKYTLIKPIGHGAYGVVISAQNTESGEKVAIKKIPHAFDDIIDAKRILREIKLLRHLAPCFDMAQLACPTCLPSHAVRAFPRWSHLQLRQGTSSQRPLAPQRDSQFAKLNDAHTRIRLGASRYV